MLKLLVGFFLNNYLLVLFSFWVCCVALLTFWKWTQSLRRSVVTNRGVETTAAKTCGEKAVCGLEVTKSVYSMVLSTVQSATFWVQFCHTLKFLNRGMWSIFLQSDCILFWLSPAGPKAPMLLSLYWKTGNRPNPSGRFTKHSNIFWIVTETERLISTYDLRGSWNVISSNRGHLWS